LATLSQLVPLSADKAPIQLRSPAQKSRLAERKGAEWVRDLFLSQIAKAEKKTEGRTSNYPQDS
jgi:hypothetical protein